MSIEIKSIEKSTYSNPLPNGDGTNIRAISYKSKSLPNDKVEILSKKELSNTSKIGIGIGIATVIGLGLEVTLGKSKHLKKLWEKISGKKPPKKPEGNKGIKGGEKLKGVNEGEKSKTSGTNLLSHIPDFKNIEEAKEYFESIGVKTFFKSGSESHLSDLNKIKDDLVILEKNGVELPKPESIIVNDWHNKDELKQILREMNIKATKADFCSSNTWAWGTVVKGTDNKCHVLINSSFSGNYGKFIHEMGHIHQDFLKSSYWHSKGLNDKEFIEKQIEIMGLSDIGIHNDGINMIIRDFGAEDTPSILRGYTSSNANSNVKTKLKQMFPSITNESDYDKLFTILGKDRKTYIINAKKMVDKMYSESGVYAPSKTWENVAEIFQGLNEGKEYSDLVMLMYDICGGGRVPNLKIKGKKYDDYIESLYSNPELIRQFRECIEVKKLV